MQVRSWQGLTRRFLLARTQRTALTALGIALGAALLAAMLTLGTTLQAAVDDRLRDQFGTWDLMVTTPDLTKGGTLAPATAAAIAALPDVAYTVPVATRPPVAGNTPVEYYAGVGRFPPGTSGLHLEQGREPGPGEMILPVSLAQRLGATMGASVALPFPGGTTQVRLVGLVKDSGAPPTARFDYTWLSQQLHLQAPPSLVIGLRLGVNKADFADQVHAAFPSLVLDRRENLDNMRRSLGGFSLVGRFLGGGSLLAAAFLVLGAFGITVQERTRELALLRAIGAGRGQVARLMLGEALLTGAAGAVLGMGLGVLGAWAMTGAVARTLQFPAHALVVPVGQIVAVGAAALVLAVAGAWPAVQRAARIAPLAAMRPDALGERRRGRTGSIVGLGLVAAAGALVAASLRPSVEPPIASQLCALAGLLLLLGMVALLPVVLPALTKVGALLLRRPLPVESTVAQRSIEGQGQRAARSAGVLVLGLTILLAIATLLQTENRSKELVLHESFPTNRQVGAPWASPTGFGDQLVQELKQVPGVADVVPTGVEIEGDLVGYDPSRANAGWLKLQQMSGHAPEHATLLPVDYAVLSRIYEFGRVDGKLGGGIAISRQLVRYRGLQLGQTLTLHRSDGGPDLHLPITAVVEHLPDGMTVEWALVQPAGAAPRYRLAHVKLAPGADPAAAKTAIMATLGSRYATLNYRDITDHLAEYQKTTDQTMALIAAATLILLVIAGAGMANTVVATLHERRRELAVLRAIGGTPRQVAGFIMLESLLIGLAGSVLGVATGALVATVATLQGWLAGLPPVLPGTLMAVGIVAGPVLAVLVAYRQVRAAANAPLMGELQRE